MVKLAISHSVVSSDALVPFIHDIYNIGDILECRFISNGLNDTYIVITNDNKYILRIYKVNWRSISDIEFEIELLNHLLANGIPVSFPVEKKDGGYHTELKAPEGPRYAVLFTYAEGGYSNSKESCSLYGEEVAKMHVVMDEFHSGHQRFELDLDHLLTKPLQSIKPLLTHRPEDIEYLESLSLLLKNRIHGLSSDLSWGVCHGDLHGGNVHFHDGSLMHFDFDCAGPGWRAYDISVFLWAKVRGREKDKFKNELWDLFLEFYQKNKKLSQCELEAVPTFVAIREIWLMGLHTGNSKVWGAWQDDHYFNKNLQFLREWCEENSINEAGYPS
ncbi:phosphotransferase enzyme family protein [Paenibacillus sp. OAS669]|uniref:phosphotransferase enzyme family protein n=1 Tax=Paenibacillus sp. OAS669 TaxID=2663821 RepID=UPI001789DEE7|nr:phosphotransferase [Paenibacillus sp. OAS669]MBE1442851.1 Ser/Thr protein kinase RdoA (MazF antagonist) [Paenibacillus sp. OAS669]